MSEEIGIVNGVFTSGRGHRSIQSSGTGRGIPVSFDSWDVDIYHCWGQYLVKFVRVLRTKYKDIFDLKGKGTHTSSLALLQITQLKTVSLTR
jgi:hypothetical protein